jgi:integrase
MAKRGQNEGSIHKRGDGRWVAVIHLGYEEGKRARKYLYGKTRQEVADKMRTALREQDAGKDLAAPSQTVRQFLETWLTDVVRPIKAAKTYASYADLLHLHVIPVLGRHRLDKLGPQQVAGLLKAKSEAGLSARTVHHIRSVLRNALNQAVRWGLVTRNAAALTEPPRQDAKEVRPFLPDQARAVLVAATGERLEALVRLALMLGLRQGEVLGLRWEDVDLDVGKLRVARALQRIDGKLVLKEPKTEKSRRTLHLPPSLVADLRAHRIRQLEERIAAGPRWQDHGMVFATGHGTPIDPRNAIRVWHRLLAKAKLERRPFHTCRHTAASLLLAEGVPVKVVQEVLGHTMLSTTADTYGHLFPEAFREAADAMERALAG